MPFPMISRLFWFHCLFSFAFVGAHQKECLLELIMIVKNESASIEETVKSSLGVVDSYTILDTGSSDNTISLIKSAFGTTPGHVFEEPFVNFAATRNRVMELAGKKCRFTIMLSGDEYIRNGIQLRRLLESNEKKHASIPGYEVVIKHGSSQYNSIRICSTSVNWHYVGVTHEYVTSDSLSRAWVLNYASNDDPFILHDTKFFDPEKKKKRWELDAELLYEEHKKDPSNQRTLFYLAQSYECLNELRHAFYYYKKRVESKGWNEEIYESLVRMGGLLQKMGYPWSESELYYLQAYQSLPVRSEPLYWIAKHYYDEKQYHIAHLFLLKASTTRFPSEVRLFISKDFYDFYIPELIANVSVQLRGQEQWGIDAAEHILSVYPGNTEMKSIISMLRTRIGSGQMMIHQRRLSDHVQLPTHFPYYHHHQEWM